MGEQFHIPEDPGYETRYFPGQITDLNGSPDPQEITRARPTGYLPDARTTPQIPYDRERDVKVPAEYSDNRFPVELLDASEIIDQHPIMHVTATITVKDDAPRKTGTRDPMISGPARPDTLLLSLYQYEGAGTDRTNYMDVPDGRLFSPYGSQDGTSWVIFQDATAALSQFNDIGQPVPLDPSRTPTAQPTLARMEPGPTHGWTSVPVVNVKQEINTKSTKQLAQQQAPHQDRKANSTVAGQTYSQRTASVRQAAAATGTGPTPGADQAWW
jgi:hypothetical protein